MAYADRSQGSSRTIAIVIVALLHAVLGYAFVTGLAYNVVKKAAEDLNVFDVEDEPPPPEEEPPPPPPDKPIEPPPVVSPPPIVQTNVAPPPIIQTQAVAPPVFTPAPVAAPPPPPPAPPRVAKKAEQRGGSISDADYPPAAVRAGDAGTTTVRFTVGADGRVSACDVTGSSGSSILDAETCKLILRRFRYRPAEDAGGAKIAETKTQRVTWRLPKD
ncbi:energy transducer TonB [Sphingomonas cavernae]|uniref:Energy transducer TonB n=1 Tax=Sphingomonas cavernae TaxID=2320861 RepID=A0A418WLF2_9SPHN|nr:energy transducer TonB [Sphingomonas cavernae]RJF90679.1 energy transducer TonB [Sphingomonas cavernae]